MQTCLVYKATSHVHGKKNKNIVSAVLTSNITINSENADDKLNFHPLLVTCKGISEQMFWLNDISMCFNRNCNFNRKMIKPFANKRVHGTWQRL